MNRMQTVLALQESLAQLGYIAERPFAATLMLMDVLQRPLLIEGEPGAGKTEIAKVLARLYNTDCVRLQCYEGLDVHAAMYEWNYQRQLLAIRLLEHDHRSTEAKEQDIFSERYLLKRPLLDSITREKPVVLLIDEIDRADEAFEAFLLELLSDYQLSIPELGTIHAKTRPWVVLTSNATRDLSDALRRRCLYHYLEYPSFEKELLIVETRFPLAPIQLVHQLVEFVQSLRHLDLQRKPGIAETLDWAAALLRLNLQRLGDIDHETMLDSLTALLKTRNDRLALTADVVKRMVAAS
jgi:MoxR-like ATPase